MGMHVFHISSIKCACNLLPTNLLLLHFLKNFLYTSYEQIITLFKHLLIIINYLKFDSKLNFIIIIVSNTYISFRLQYCEDGRVV